jgi:hypothetical protein
MVCTRQFTQVTRYILFNTKKCRLTNVDVLKYLLNNYITSDVKMRLNQLEKVFAYWICNDGGLLLRHSAVLLLLVLGRRLLRDTSGTCCLVCVLVKDVIHYSSVAGILVKEVFWLLWANVLGAGFNFRCTNFCFGEKLNCSRDWFISP